MFTTSGCKGFSEVSVSFTVKQGFSVSIYVLFKSFLLSQHQSILGLDVLQRKDELAALLYTKTGSALIHLEKRPGIICRYLKPWHVGKGTIVDSDPECVSPPAKSVSPPAKRLVESLPERPVTPLERVDPSVLMTGAHVEVTSRLPTPPLITRCNKSTQAYSSHLELGKRLLEQPPFLPNKKLTIQPKTPA
ncbi:hypothetical protein TNCT_308691 [Trichonephila clavata]|uniref:Uncharacterized protein n=1 Tax=Trichonephila clavata TaxID=2740835 RepID=A0A8X6LTC1_TRICU|nr:hypothetical protein TNCT_308691 [Trichonephila clavata]